MIEGFNKADKVGLDGRQYEFLGYYEEKDWMMFRSARRSSGLDPDKKISKNEFEEICSNGEFERIQDHEDDNFDEMEKLRLAILPDWIENKELFADRLYGDRDLIHFIGFDEERRAVTIDECNLVHHRSVS